MSTDDFSYELPPSAIAQVPVEPRDSARLLVALGDAPVSHRSVADLPDLLHPGDLVVVNDTRVSPARLHLAKRGSGGAVEVLLLEPIVDGMWEALIKPGGRVRPGSVLCAADGLPVIEVGAHLGDGRRQVRLLTDPDPYGEVALPPYITVPLADPGRYQTVYAAQPGSVAAPTAGLHLTTELLQRIRDRGVEVATVELVVGIGTFRPITAEQVEGHEMHAERFRVPAATMAACRAAERVVAIGTTTVRALESAAASGQAEGRTSLFIHGDYEFRVVDLLLTNFHLPRSSLLVMLEAFCGPRWRELYRVALAEGYRFLSFGDAMFVNRGAAAC